MQKLLVCLLLLGLPFSAWAQTASYTYVYGNVLESDNVTPSNGVFTLTPSGFPGGTSPASIRVSGGSFGASVLASVPYGAAYNVSYTNTAGTYTFYETWVVPVNSFGVSRNDVRTSSGTPTTISSANTSVTFSSSPQNVTLSATVTSGSTVNSGTVTFGLYVGASLIGTAVTSSTVSSGAASATYSVPASQAPGTYTILAKYNPGAGLGGSTDTAHTLAVLSAGGGGTPGGSNGQVQVNSSGSFGGVSLTGLIYATSGVPAAVVCTGYVKNDGTCSTPVTTFSVSAIPSIFTASVANATSTPALSITAATSQTSHQVFGTCGTATSFAPCSLVAGDIPTLNQNTTGTASNVTGIVAISNGGTGTSSPGLIQGTNVTISGSWPNQTISSTGGGGGGGSGGGVVSVVDTYSAVGNGQQSTNCAITSGSAALTCTGGSFASGDVGKSIWVVGAGSSGAWTNVLSTTISTYTSATQVTLAANATATVSGATVVWGHDDSTAFASAMSGANGQTIRIPYTGNRFIVGPLTPPAGTKIVMDPGAAIEIKPASLTQYQSWMTVAYNNFEFDGDGAYLWAPFSEYGSEYQHCFSLEGISNVSIRGINIDGCGGDGFYVSNNSAGTAGTYVSNALIDHVTVNHMHRQGISVISAKHMVVSNSTFSNDCCDGTSPSYNNPGIDIEPNSTTDVVTDINFVNINSYGNKGAGLGFATGNQSNTSTPEDINVTNWTSTGDGLGAISAGCEPTVTTGTQIPGRINLTDIHSINSAAQGIYLINYSVACPVMHFEHLYVLNPNQTASAQEALGLDSGGGNTLKFGNISIRDLQIVDTRGTPKVSFYYGPTDYSNTGISNIQIECTLCTGAANAGTEGAGYSLEEPQLQTTATPIFDASIGDPLPFFHVTLNKNVTSSTLINTFTGQQLRWEVCSSGSYSFTWPTNVKGGTTTSIVSGKCLEQSFKVGVDGNGHASDPGTIN